MRIKQTLGTVIFLILSVVYSLSAEATENSFSFPDRNQIEEALQIFTENCGPLVCIEGEISAVTAELISLRETGQGERTFSINAAEFFVNGQAGAYTALRPIAPGFNFAARLYFDHNGVLRLVDGWYVGVEAEILAVDPGRCLLTVQPLDHAQTGHFMLSPLLPANSPLPAPGKICFILFDWEQRVRRIVCAP